MNTLRLLFLCIISLRCIATANAQPVYQWARGMGGSADDEGFSCRFDVAGNVYVAGSFSDVVDFDPGPGVKELTAFPGTRDVFIAKYDPSGDYLWAIAMEGAGSCDGAVICLDAGGNVYVTGHFVDSVDFDPGPGEANLGSSGFYDIFVAKYNASGVYQWAFGIGGDGAGYSRGKAIRLDKTGNIFIGGDFQSKVDFDPGPNAAPVTAAGAYDVFFAKYDPSGKYLWAKSVGTARDETLRDMGLDKDGNIYMTGIYTGPSDFDPGADSAILIGDLSCFIAKYDASGNYLWADGLPGSGGSTGTSLEVDASGNVTFCGSFSGTVDLDPGPDTILHQSAGQGDIFLAQYNDAGKFRWAKTFGGPAYDYAMSLKLDGGGNVYLTGSFGDSVNFDSALGKGGLHAAGSDDIFIARYDRNGNFGWARRLGGEGLEQAVSIDRDKFGAIVITGKFESQSIDFDPSVNDAMLSSTSFFDIFVAKYSDATARVADAGHLDDIMLYPNPAHSILTFKLGNLSEKTQIILSDILGRSISAPIIIRGMHAEVNVASLRPGVYTLTILEEKIGRKTSKRFIKIE